MISIYSLTNILHKLILAALLLALTIIPLIVNIDVITAFVFIPSLLVITISISLMIEHQLEKMRAELSEKTVINQNSNKANICIIRKGIYCLQRF